ncbi:hypothetical protein BCR32DRAFT_287666 [Anaeromyces robustus]|uniref:Uncharacterized protein n=1 Tax=Anaeromyces robustus TaxID=1754192 RepID=A0A1Y1VQL6_9FUNG|nr:hypothetical protein BCR32DRAFT_287666 [Anaeromyces robustus]|eukprot:ORX63569.1 hypothetical protein BCR32DRAFT_287666 [Anaeromyces robustus]
MEFPVEWDRTNPRAVSLYNKCKKFYDKGEEDKLVDVFKPDYPMFYIGCAGYVILFLRQCHINSLLYEQHKENVIYDNKKEKDENKGIIKRFCLYFTEKRIKKAILFYITFSLFFVTVISVFEIGYSMHPVSQGFCSSALELIPLHIITNVFLFIFLPITIYEIRKIDKKFSFKIIVKLSTFIMLTFSIIYTITGTAPVYTCTSISKNFPADIYYIVLFFSVVILHVSIPIAQSFKAYKKIASLDVTKKSLHQVFENEKLYKEFFEYAVQKRSSEYVIFHKDYEEFKNIFKNNRSFFDELSASKVLSPGINPVNQKEKKFIEIFEQVYNKVDEIFTKYFSSNSDLELNLTDKLVKKVTTDVYNYTIYYNRYVVNGNEGTEINMKQLNCEKIFEEVHTEAMEALFLNVYLPFAKDQKKLFGYNGAKQSCSTISKSSHRISYNSKSNKNTSIISTTSSVISNTRINFIPYLFDVDALEARQNMEQEASLNYCIVVQLIANCFRSPLSKCSSFRAEVPPRRNKFHIIREKKGRSKI